MASKPHVYIKPNTIEYGEYKINKNGKREFIPHLHSIKGRSIYPYQITDSEKPYKSAWRSSLSVW